MRVLTSLLVLAGLAPVLAGQDTAAARSDTSAAPQAWVNTASGVYHCPGARSYGTTKAARYMREADAQAAHYRPAYGRSCAPSLATSLRDTTQIAAPGAAATAIKVWVNTSSGVYHCPGTRYYGTTKQGRYMTESDARASGFRPAYNRPCS